MSFRERKPKRTGANLGTPVLRTSRERSENNPDSATDPRPRSTPASYNHPEPVPTPRTLIRPLLLFAATALSAPCLGAQAPGVQPAAVPPTPRRTRTPKPTPTLFNPGVIFLDPAHGGSDPGSTLAPDSFEKDTTLAFAKTLRTLLTAAGFSVSLTHEYAATPTAPTPRPAPPADATPEQLAAFEALPPQPAFNPGANNPTLDARAEQANRSHAAACIIIHATAAGRGVHLYTASLIPPPSATVDPDPLTRPIIPWDAAQAASLVYSNRLAADLAGALAGARIPYLTGHISTRPIDSFTCPAVVLELAPPERAPAKTTAADSAWQQRVAQSLVAALETWRAHALPPAPAMPAIPAPNPLTTKPAAKPTSKAGAPR